MSKEVKRVFWNRLVISMVFTHIHETPMLTTDFSAHKEMIKVGMELI
jgi:hypothetical protein